MPLNFENSEKNLKKNRIAITTYTMSQGGVANFILQLAKRLKEANFEVDVVCTDSPGEWFPLLNQNHISAYDLKLGILGWFPFGRVIHSFFVGNFLKKNRYQIILNNHSFFVHAAAKIFRSNSFLVSVIHNQKPQMVELECRSQSDLIVCVSKKIFDTALNYSPQVNTKLILNGAVFSEQGSFQSVSIESIPLKILYVGRLDDHQKSVLSLPDILQLLVERKCDVHLSIVGSGPDEKKLSHKIEALNLPNISFLGSVSPEKISTIYQNHHILLLPSKFEGLPLTLIESMGNGCVPVASLLPDSTDLCVTDGENGFLVDPQNISGFADKIELLYNNRETLGNMRELAIFRANRDFSIAKMHEQYLSAIQSLLEQKERPFNTAEKRSYFTWREIVPFHLILKWKKRFGWKS